MSRATIFRGEGRAHLAGNRLCCGLLLRSKRPRADASTVAVASVADIGAAGLSEVVVTAQKRETNLQKTRFALAEVDRRWGSVDAYLDKALGVDAAAIAGLRKADLE